MGATVTTERKNSMAHIGTFTPYKSGYIGQINTLALDIKVEFIPNTDATPNAPAYRVVSGKAVIGAAWLRVSEALKPYLSVVLDDPSFAAPIYANLVDSGDGKHALIWSRR